MTSRTMVCSGSLALLDVPLREVPVTGGILQQEVAPPGRRLVEDEGARPERSSGWLKGWPPSIRLWAPIRGSSLDGRVDPAPHVDECRRRR